VRSLTRRLVPRIQVRANPHSLRESRNLMSLEGLISAACLVILPYSVSKGARFRL
jgi:hypothetical protein